GRALSGGGGRDRGGGPGPDGPRRRPAAYGGPRDARSRLRSRLRPQRGPRVAGPHGPLQFLRVRRQQRSDRRAASRGMTARPRIAVTGAGAVSPFGDGAAALWDGLTSGAGALAPITRFDTSHLRSHVAALVGAHDPR